MDGCRHFLQTMMLFGEFHDHRGQHRFHLFVRALTEPHPEKCAGFAIRRFNTVQAIDMVQDLEQMAATSHSLDSSDGFAKTAQDF